MPRPPPTTVSPEAPEMRLRTPTSGGSAPEMRRTFQVPSSSLIRSANTDGDRVPGARNVQLVQVLPLLDPDRPGEIGLEVARLRDLEERPRPGEALRPGVGRDDLLAVDLR